MALTPPTFRWLSDTVLGIYRARTRGELAAGLTRALSRQLRVSYSGCEELSRAGSDIVLHGVATEVTPSRDWMAFIHDHPVLPLLRNLPRIAQVRELVSRAEFERTDYYNGVARPYGWSDNVILRMRRAPTAVTASVFRDRVFTAEERSLLGLLQPHLEAAWRRVAVPARALLHGGGRRLRISPALAPVGLEPTLQARLRSYFPGWRDAARLPGALRDWAESVRAELRPERFMRPTHPLRPLMVENAQGILFVCYFPIEGTDAAELRFIEQPAELLRWSSVLALSGREREVLHWLAEGKRDAEIAIILGLAPKTVAKHVEHLLAKLRVPNRTAAACFGTVG